MATSRGAVTTRSSRPAVSANSGILARIGCQASRSAKISHMEDASRVVDAWTRIERWLAEHAPASHGQLNPPAERSLIVEAERVLGVRFPPSLVTLLSLRNGTSEWKEGSYEVGVRFLPGGYRLVPVDEIVRSSQMLTEIAQRSERENPESVLIGWWWHPSWLPFANVVWGGAYFTDQRTGGEGEVGEFVKDDEARLAQRPSLAAMLAEIADAVETGTDVGIWRPQVVGGRLDWEIVPSALRRL